MVHFILCIFYHNLQKRSCRATGCLTPRGTKPSVEMLAGGQSLLAEFLSEKVVCTWEARHQGDERECQYLFCVPSRHFDYVCQVEYSSLRRRWMAQDETEQAKCSHQHLSAHPLKPTLEYGAKRRYLRETTSTSNSRFLRKRLMFPVNIRKTKWKSLLVQLAPKWQC